MGSLISSKMAAPAARVIQAVRPRAPLIKFPDRQAIPRPNTQEVLKALALNLPQHSSSPSAPAPPQSAPPHRPLTLVPGVPDSLASIQQMPARYRRRPLTLEEMDYIQVSIVAFTCH
uniref:Mitochondrial ribosomal protein S36 n=1 Tax=Oryzias latipes TaxID=8090 RepID=A0A3P9HYQ3_ORYLA